MTPETRIQLIETILTMFWKTPVYTVEHLAGDAGTRVYYRSRCGSDTIVVMDTGQPLDATTDSFILVSNYLTSHKIPVPRIHEIHPSHGILLLDDLGECSLQQAYITNPGLCIDFLYPSVLHVMIHMHRTCTQPRINPPGSVFSTRFDYEKLRWELDFFVTHFITGFRRIRLTPAASVILHKTFETVCRVLDTERPIVFTHRDFHSRNVMVRDNNIFLIDYQDARLGPPEYDLASLLRDAYVELPGITIDRLLTSYHEATNDRRPIERKMTIFSYMCLQRNFKALGTFGYQAAVRGNPTYLPYIPILYRHLLAELERIDRFRDRTLPELPDIYGLRSIIDDILR
ncbi:phosphotransferase [bacterium]|nr:phosphotransferase [candidate division CSSED10-310 bacterium]